MHISSLDLIYKLIFNEQNNIKKQKFLILKKKFKAKKQ